MVERLAADPRALLRTLLDQMTDAVAFVDRDGVYIDGNDAFFAMAGAPREAVLGRTVDDFVPPELAAKLRAQDLDVLTRNAPATYEVWTAARGLNTPTLLHARKSPVGPPGGAPLGVLMVLRDITAERTAALITKTEHALARVLDAETSRDALFRAILDLAVDLPGLECGGIYARRGDGGYELMHHRGLSEAFVRAVAEVGPDTTRAKLLEMGRILVSFEAPDRFVVEPRILGSEIGRAERLRCGVVLPLRVGAEIVGCINLAGREVERLSEGLLVALEAMQTHFGHALRRLDAERRAALERSNFVNAFDAIQDMVFVLNERGDIVHHNRAVLTELGFAPGELLGAPVTVVHPPEAQAEVARVLDDMLAGRRRSCPVSLRAKDGRVIEVETRAVRGEWDGAPAILGISRDIGQQRETERALVRARKHADATSAAKSEFLANMSHEIRTPMNAILGLTQLTLELPLGDEQREYTRQAHGAAVSLLGIVNDVLDFSKIEARKVEFERVPFALQSVLDRVCAVHEQKAREKGLTLTASLDEAVPRGLLGDAMRLTQVLHNLVGNAIKFSSRGRVSLRVSRLDSPDARAHLRFEVRDEGVGLDPALREHIFRPFTQADGSISRRFGGTGLGLAISHQLVALFGGTLDVESAPGEGSCFFFDGWFGETQAPAPHDRALPRTEPNPLQGLRVLLVEDNPVNQLLGVKLLEKCGLVPTAVDNGAEALRVLDARPDGFDAVLMDIQMPVLDGLAATRRLRADRRFDALPIIAVTAHAFAEDRTRCFEAGMQDYVSKPFDLDRLLYAIEVWHRR
jgi:PAS domain S-box-containing protein